MLENNYSGAAAFEPTPPVWVHVNYQAYKYIGLAQAAV